MYMDKKVLLLTDYHTFLPTFPSFHRSCLGLKLGVWSQATKSKWEVSVLRLPFCTVGSEALRAGRTAG